MKKYLIALVVAVGTFGVFASSAAAWVQDGTCRLHAYTPSDQQGGIAAHGRIDTCGGITGQARMQLEVCLRWWNSGNPVFVGSCDTGPETVALSEDVWSHVYYGAHIDYHYQTWDEGTVGGTTARYQSSWITYYG